MNEGFIFNRAADIGLFFGCGFSSSIFLSVLVWPAFKGGLPLGFLGSTDAGFLESADFLDLILTEPSVFLFYEGGRPRLAGSMLVDCCLGLLAFIGIGPAMPKCRGKMMSSVFLNASSTTFWIFLMPDWIMLTFGFKMLMS